jgi:hypothetical protein
MNALEMPDNLLPLPPVPEGYDRWEYRGIGWKPDHFVCYGFCPELSNRWRSRGGKSLPDGSYDTHYIEAVKDEQLHAPGDLSEWWETGEPVQLAREPEIAHFCGGKITGLYWPSSIESLVAADIAARQRTGIAKYGTTIEANPLPMLGWLRHAYKECIDQAVYLRQAIAAIEGTNEEKP